MTAKPLRIATVALALAAAVAPAAQAQDERFVPGYTDFPNALRVETDAQRGAARFTAGHSDFPNHLRVESVYDKARGHSGVERPAVVVAAPDRTGFDWIDAGIGAGGAAGVLLLAAGGAMLALRRPVRSTALTG